MKSLTPFLVLLALLVTMTIVWFIGCTAMEPVKKELTPEQQQAIQDSLLNVHKREMALIFSFGYEPYKQKDYKKAKGYFLRVANKDTLGIYGKIVYQLLGDCYLQLNDPDSSEWAMLKGKERIPDNPYFYESLGYIYRGQNRTEEAIEMYSKLTVLNPDSVKNYKVLGQLYLDNGDPDAAIESYEKAVEMNPNDQRTQEILASLYEQYRDFGEILAKQEGLVEQFPENTEYRLDLAKSYFQDAQYEKAIEQLNIVVEKEPENTEALRYQGDSYQEIEKYTNAAAAYTKIDELNPEDKNNMCNLAMTYTQLGRFTTAMQWVRKALAIQSDYGLAYIARGMIYETAADRCVDKKNGKIEFDDKLVYKKAYDEYIRAKKDMQFMRDASNRMIYVEPLIPSKADYFMHKNQSVPNSECYSWM